MSIPEAFRQRIRAQKYIDADKLFIALKNPGFTAIRINRGKWGLKPAYSEPVTWCTAGFYLESRPSYTLDPLYHSGCYYSQESSGMFLEQVLKQIAKKSGKLRVLDLCGAPGGKATHLSSLIDQDDLLVANEVIRSRASILAENITKWGSGNTLVTRNDPAEFGNLKGFFDIILVDAPCSGEGMFRDPVAVSEWSYENTLLCSERQKRILVDIWPALKREGILIYSTCTFNPGENEEVIKWLIVNSKAETINLDISDFKEITEIDFQGIRGYGFYPGKCRGEGLFLSVVRKTGDQEEIRIRSKPDNRFRIPREEEKIATEWINKTGSTLLKSGNDIFTISCSCDDYMHILKNLRLIKPGTRIGTVKKDRFLPDHELAMYNNFNKSACHGVDIDYYQAVAFLSRENIELANIPKGWINVRYKEVSLGFINNIGSRINNYYPLDWRIRINRKNHNNIEKIKWI